jgi:uncharacterized protein
MSRIAGFLAAAFFTLCIVSLQSAGLASAQTGEPMLLPVDPAPLVASTRFGELGFSVEIADDNEERARGLMFRRDLPQTRGMLFVFENTRRVGFWMENTPLPLDLVFIREDGRIESILPGVPFSRETIPSQGQVRFVLEVHQGTAQQAGMKAGDRLHHPVIDAIAGTD